MSNVSEEVKELTAKLNELRRKGADRDEIRELEQKINQLTAGEKLRL